MILMPCWMILLHASGPGCRTGDDAWVAGGNGHLAGPGGGAGAATATEPNQPQPPPAAPPGATVPSTPAPPRSEDPELISARLRMVREQIESRGVRDPRVLEVMRRVPRHLFVPQSLGPYAYDDSPLPIGEGQTISQPYIVALMTELLRLKPGDKVLEVGTGSGYQAAVLAELGAVTYTVEIVEPLAAAARRLLESMGYGSIQFRTGDGYRGWAEASPFDAVIVTAAPDHVPQPLVDQLKIGGRLVIPVGVASQDLQVITKTERGTRVEEVIPVRFVPMTGEAQQKPH